MLLYGLLIGCFVQFRAAQECSSPTFNFANYVNPEELDLTTSPDTVIARFPVENVRTVSVVPQPIYISARLVGSELQFVTTANITQYEEHEVQIVIIVQMAYTCTTGQRQGIFRQNLKPANNHAPRFLAESYEALVPLPLPKHFDVSPYLANGVGVMARDIDLINNSVQFSVSENNYFIIESHPVVGDLKQFKAVLLLKEQVLKLANAVELTVTATDRGIPSKASHASVIIRPDLSIIYDDPPEFKDTFVNRTMDQDIVVQLELIPGTKTDDVQYTLQGSDSNFFRLSVWANNSGLDLSLVNLNALPKAKSFLNVIAVAKRSELQKTSSVILLSIPSGSKPNTSSTTVNKALAVLHLEEMTQHSYIFPLTIESCVFSIESQTPGEYFFVDEANRTLCSKAFDREDELLFHLLDFPQFWVVLKLNCPSISNSESISSSTDRIRLGPMRDIAYSTDLTHLNIVVMDINDNSPEFTAPVSNARFAFPSANLAQLLLPEQVVKVQAIDRDEGINAIIQYRLTQNEHFSIDARTGVIFPFKNALSSESSTTLHVHATDRDGAEDGNTSTMNITVVRADADKLAALTVHDVNPPILEEILTLFLKGENITLGVIRSVHSFAEDRSTYSDRTSNVVSAIIYAFEGDTLVPYKKLVSVLKPLQATFNLKMETINDLYMSQSTNTVIFPYIIVAAFFGTVAIAMAAAAFYFRAKNRQLAANSLVFPPETASVNSNSIIVENVYNAASSTPPLEIKPEQQLHDVTTNEPADNPEASKTVVRSLTELLSIDEDPEDENYKTEPYQPTEQDRKKSIKFNEHVERIEVFDKYTDK